MNTSTVHPKNTDQSVPPGPNFVREPQPVNLPVEPRTADEAVERGSTIVSDGLASYPPAVAGDYLHRPVNVSRSGQKAHVLLPGVHRVASLAKRWLLGTHQGAVEVEPRG